MRAAIFVVFLMLAACSPDTTIIQQTPKSQVFAGYSFYNETPVTYTFAAANTYINLTETNECTGSPGMCDDYTINIQADGYYSAQHHISFAGGPTVEYHTDIGVNGVERTKCHGAQVIGTEGEVGNMGGTCILYLTTGDQVTLMLENEDNTQSINVQDASFNVVLI